MPDVDEAAVQTTEPSEAVVTEQSVMDRISGMLEGEQQTPEPEETEPLQEESQTEPVEEATEAEETEAEEQKIEDVLPDTLQALAEEIGLDVGEFAKYLKVPIKGKDGETTTVTLDEAINGYTREAVFTQKSQELAERRRQVEAQAQQAQQHLASQIDQVSQVMAQIQAEVNETTEADLLRILDEEGSESYLRAKDKYDKQVQALVQGQQAIVQHQQQVTQQTQQQLAEYRVQQVNLLKEKAPDLADAKHQEQFVKELMPYLQDMGFGEPELQQLATTFDHRFMLMARDGMKWRALQKGKSQAKKLDLKLPHVTKPGQARRRTSGDDLASARNRLKSMKGRTKVQQDQIAVDYIKQIL